MAERHIYRDALTNKTLAVPPDFRGEIAPARWVRMTGQVQGQWPKPIRPEP